jgi:hypothetical protein
MRTCHHLPQVKTLPSFMEKARKLKWIESMLEHIVVDSSDLADAAEWICYYIGKRHDTSLTLASETLGYPLVQRMDGAAAEAMWADANINISQQCIIKRHLRYCIGKRIFVAEKTKPRIILFTLSLLFMESTSIIKMVTSLRNLRNVPFGLGMQL